MTFDREDESRGAGRGDIQVRRIPGTPFFIDLPMLHRVLDIALCSIRISLLGHGPELRSLAPLTCGQTTRQPVHEDHSLGSIGHEHNPV